MDSNLRPLQRGEFLPLWYKFYVKSYVVGWLMLQIVEIAGLVNKLQSPKQVELMATILSDVDKLDFNSLYKNAIKRWLEEELKETVQPLTPTSSPLPTTDVEELDTSQENEIVDEKNIEGEEDEEDKEEDKKTEESNDSNISDANNPKGFGVRMGTPSVLLFVLIVLICVMRWWKQNNDRNKLLLLSQKIYLL